MKDWKGRDIKFNYIDDSVEITFGLSSGLKDLIRQAEQADLLEDYGLYMNIANAIDAMAKNEVNRHLMSESQWNLLTKKYQV